MILATIRVEDWWVESSQKVLVKKLLHIEGEGAGHCLSGRGICVDLDALSDSVFVRYYDHFQRKVEIFKNVFHGPWSKTPEHFREEILKIAHSMNRGRRSLTIRDISCDFPACRTIPSGVHLASRTCVGDGWPRYWKIVSAPDTWKDDFIQNAQ